MKLEENDKTLNKLKSAFYSLAIGDAIGFITESTGLSNTDLRDWRYPKGTFSDDTQLTLLTVEALDDDGRFDPNRFSQLMVKAYKKGELRGIGLSTKLAIESLMKGTKWYENFYEGRINYVETGANGCAMRILPIGIVNDCLDKIGKARLVEDTLRNSIITHGHPRAHVSAILLAMSYSYIFRDGNLSELIDFLIDEFPNIDTIKKYLPNGWIERWNHLAKDESKTYSYMKDVKNYEDLYEKIANETKDLMRELWDEFMNLDNHRIFRRTNAIQFRGSGTATVVSAIFVFLRYPDDFEKSVITCAGDPSIDSDTVASMVGALYGLENGLDESVNHYSGKLNDLETLNSAISKIHRILVEK